MWKNAMLQPQWEGARTPFVSAKFFEFEHAERAWLVRNSHHEVFRRDHFLLWTRNMMKTNRGRGRPRHTNHPRCTCTDGHVTKLITPAGVVELVVLSKLPHIL